MTRNSAAALRQILHSTHETPSAREAEQWRACTSQAVGAGKTLSAPSAQPLERCTTPHAHTCGPPAAARHAMAPHPHERRNGPRAREAGSMGASWKSCTVLSLLSSFRVPHSGQPPGQQTAPHGQARRPRAQLRRPARPPEGAQQRRAELRERPDRHLPRRPFLVNSYNSP